MQLGSHRPAAVAAHGEARLYGIGDLAAEFGISARTIRFYEDEGLISPARAGQARVYTYRDRARLMLILRGKRLGFTLADIKEFLDLYDADQSQSRQLAHTLGRTRARIAELEQQLADITATLAELRELEATVLAHQNKSPESNGR